MARLFFILKSLLILVITMQLTMANAQFAIGIEGGYTANYFKRDIPLSLTEKNPLPGYAATVYLQYTPHRLFTLQAAAQLLQKNYEKY